MFVAVALLAGAAIGCFAEDAPVGGGVVRSSAELSRELEREGAAPRAFDITATLTSDIGPEIEMFTVQDESGYAMFADWRKKDGREPLACGDRVRIVGRVRDISDIGRMASVRTVTFLAHGTVPPPVEATAAEIYSGRLTFARVRVRGRVVDAFRDEANPVFTFLALSVDDGTVYLPSSVLTDERIAPLVGAEIEAMGLCTSYRNKGPRAKLGYEVLVERADDVTVLKPAPADPFDVPLLGGTVYDVFRMQAEGPARRKVRGEVVAVWQGNRLLLRTPEGTTPTVVLVDERAPRCGEFIEAVGLPETDFYNLNVSRAIWRTTSPLAVSNPPPETVSADFLLTDGVGRREFKVEYHGRPVRLSGIVQNPPLAAASAGVFHILSGESIIPVDASAIPEVWEDFRGGAKVEVTGVCLMTTENWRPQVPFPHVQGAAVVLRSPDDLVILSRPPWWTTRRLMAVIGSLLLVLLGILVWNRTLRRLVERRGRQLFKAQIEKAESDLRIDERTRLAVELHDSISQNLTGVALEVNAADRKAEADLPSARRHLNRAAQTLKSCREELRNCIWDLRSNALGEQTMDDAVRKTLEQQIGETRLVVRFAVPRRKLTDPTAHAILRIIRELVMNGIRHGGATEVRVAGSEEKGRILFSVQDNGAGFDAANAPGIAEGHFGLQGIRERVKGFQGSVEIKSAPGKGAKVTVKL